MLLRASEGCYRIYRIVPAWFFLQCWSTRKECRMRYTTPEWLLENLERRLRLALEQRPVPENKEHLPNIDPIRNLAADGSAQTTA
jgi:hypothetical protein